MNENEIIITNHALLQYYLYTNGTVTDNKIMCKNILRDYDVSNIYTQLDNITITQSNKFNYYFSDKYLLSLHPKFIPVLIDNNTLIKSDELVNEDRNIINLLFKIQQIIIVRHEYNKYIGFADKFVIFYNIQYGENNLVTFNVESIINVSDIHVSEINRLIKIKETYFNDKEYEWEQFINLIEVGDRIFKNNNVIYKDNKSIKTIKKSNENINIEIIKKEDVVTANITKNNIIDKEEEKNTFVLIGNTKIYTIIGKKLPLISKKLSYKVDVNKIINEYGNIVKNNLYNIEDKTIISKYIDALKDDTKTKDFNKYWSIKIPKPKQKSYAKTIMIFLFNNILHWNKQDIYNKFSSVMLRDYKLDKMLTRVFDSVAINVVLNIYPDMQVFLFKSLNLFTWYYVRQRDGVEHVKDTINWIAKNDKIDISTKDKILKTNWFDVLSKYDLQNILTCSLYKSNLQLFFKEIFNIII